MLERKSTVNSVPYWSNYLFERVRRHLPYWACLKMSSVGSFLGHRVNNYIVQLNSQNVSQNLTFLTSKDLTLTKQ